MNFSPKDKIGEVACSPDTTLEEPASSSGVPLQDLLAALEKASSPRPSC